MILKDYDLLETAEVTVRGRVETAAVKVQQPAPRRDVAEAGRPAVDAVHGGGRQRVRPGAAKYARQNDPNWHDTGLDVTTDQPLEITADGTVDLAPQQPGQYVSGPGGNPSNGNTMLMTPNGGRMQAIPGAPVRPDRPGRHPVHGRHEPQDRPARRRTAGCILKIGPSNWGGIDPTGSYKVKVRVGG